MFLIRSTPEEGFKSCTYGEVPPGRGVLGGFGTSVPGGSDGRVIGCGILILEYRVGVDNR